MHALIWTPSAWLSPSECVWASSKIKVEGKMSIQDIYDSKKPLTDMFINGLKIPKPSLEMHIGSLAKLAKTQGLIADIIAVMEQIAALKRPDGELKTKLQGLNIFPIKQGRNHIRASLSAEFAVIDKSIFRRYFEDMIYVLDFSDRDFWRTKDFLTACGLGDRFMSERLVEKTGVINAVLFESRTNDLRSKAYALLRYTLLGCFFLDTLANPDDRYAVHCRSIRTQDSYYELYEHLKNISILQSDNMRTSLSITQSSQTYTVSTDKVGIHFDEGDSLKIYVPADPRDLKRCWPIDIIPRLKKWLGVSDRLLDDVLQQIFIRDDLEILDEDLEKKGIITVEGVERAQSIMNPATPSDKGTRAIASSTSTLFNAAYSNWSLSSYKPHPHSPGQIFGYAENERTQDGLDVYREILNEVIHAAQSKHLRDRHDPQLPLPAFSDMDRISSAFGPTFTGRSRNMHRDRRVGAAGELFVGDCSRHDRIVH